MIRAVFLDIDNTLLSFTGFVRQAMREGFRRFGLGEYDEAMLAVFERVNGGLWRRIEKGEIAIADLRALRWNGVFEALGIDFDGAVFEDYFREALFSSAIPEPGALELLEYLAPRYALCAASNGPYAQQLNRLRVGGMLGYFAHVFVSEQLGAQKPDARFFERCFDRLRASGLDGLSPRETVIIGDSLSSDMAGGIGFGMRTCLYRRRPGIRPANVDYVVSNLAEIREFL